MELESLYYFKELTRDLNMTKTAKRLFLSQQTLSNHIARLEKWCGTSLFYRKPRLSLTTAGLSLLDFANRVLNQESEFKDVLADIIDESRGVIRFGASFVRYNDSLPAILPTFSERYPNVSLQLVDDTTSDLVTSLVRGELDVIITASNVAQPGLTSQLLLTNKIYMCVSDKLLKKYYGDKAEQIKQQSRMGAHIEDFAKLPIVMLTPPNRLGTIIANCYEEVDCTPNIYLQTDLMRMVEPIASKALAATFTTTMPLSTTRSQLAPDVNIFPLLYKDEPIEHNLYLVYYENRYYPQYTQYFMKLLEEYFANGEDLDLTYVANIENRN